MNLELFDKTDLWIDEQLSRLANPCVACSFGKDSMVMLHLIVRHRPDIPVVYVEQFPHPTKHQFMERMACEWNLNMQPALPVAWRTYYGQPGHVEIVTGYHIGPQATIVVPSEPMGELDESSCMCGIDILNQDVVPGKTPAFDGAFIGQRDDDVDVVMGNVAVSGNRDVIETKTFRYLYPLKDWTSKDIWDYHRRYEVPANSGRYGRQDPEFNNDVWNLCTKCLADSGEVFCPKEREVIPAFGDIIELSALTNDIRNAALNWENIAS